MSLLVATALMAAQTPAAAVAEIYEPYRTEGAGTASWEYPIYTAALTRLIAAWIDVMPDDEPDELNDGDWLCMCQDWSPDAFAAVVTGQTKLSGGRVRVAVRVTLDSGQTRRVRLVLKREGGEWKIDDLFGDDFPLGLRHKLIATTVADAVP